MTLHRLLYRSHSAIEGSAAEIDATILALVESSQAANRVSGITGALLMSSDAFVQVIEGPLKAVEATFERICGDLRHRYIQLIEFSAVETRSFDEWPLAALAPKDDVMNLCASLDTVRGTRIDAASASATIDFMRTLAVTSAHSWRYPPAETPAPAQTS